MVTARINEMYMTDVRPANCRFTPNKSEAHKFDSRAQAENQIRIIGVSLASRVVIEECI